MPVRIAQPEDLMREARKFYMKDFHKVSDSGVDDKFHEKQYELSGIKEKVDRGEKVRGADIAGGSGRQGYVIRKKLGDNADAVDIDCFDISRKELGEKREKSRIVAEMTQIPAADKTYDVVFINNMAIPLYKIARYVESMKAEGMKDARESMLEMLNLAMSSAFKLNLLEAARILKDDGVIVFGSMYDDFNRKHLERGINDLPLKVEKFQIKKYDEKLVPVWKNYGADVNKPKFVHVVLKKTGGEMEELVALHQQILDTSLRQLMRIDGFDDVLKEMKKANKIKPGKSFRIEEKFNFDVGGREPDPPWPGFFG